MRLRKKLALPFGIAALFVFAACDVTSKSLTESDVRTIIQEEFASEAFSKKVEEGIDAFIKKQEAERQVAQEEASKPRKVEGVTADDDPVKGDPNAPVTIIEFSDFECPFCARHFQTVYPEIVKQYVDTGKVKYVFRDFPLGFHQSAIPAAVAANCARDQGDDKTYFSYHDKLFVDQKALTRDTFVKYAKELGLDTTAFTTCLDSGKYDEEIQNDVKDGAKYGISGTPAFFINGWFIKGAFPFEAFQQLIEQELNPPASPSTESAAEEKVASPGPTE